MGYGATLWLPRRLLTDAVPILAPVVILTLCGVLIGWRIHVYGYNRSRGTSAGRFLHKIHLWRPFSYSPQPRYCNGCRQLISGFLLFRNMGYECQCCGLYSHLSCLLLCERSSCKAPGRVSHQFREGNLDSNAVCALCGVVCSSSFSLFGLECLWCRKVFHAACLERSKESRQPIGTICDLGPLAHLVVPPSALTTRTKVPQATRKPSLDVTVPQSPTILSAPAMPNHSKNALLEGVSSSTANVDVDTKPVRRVALSARKANDWLLINFPDSNEINQIHSFWNQALNWLEPSKGDPQGPVSDNSTNDESAAGVNDNSPLMGEAGGNPSSAADQAGKGSNSTTAKTSSKGHKSMKLLRSLVKSKEASSEQSLTVTADQWADIVCQLFYAVSDLMMLLERTGVFPFVVFVNPKSGGQLGSLILKESYAYLNPWQVVDMSIEKSPLDALTRFQGLSITGRLRALACGGDGTVSWVIDSAQQKFSTIPSFETLTKLYQSAKEYQSSRSAGSPVKDEDDLKKLLHALKTIHWEPAQVPVAVLPLGTGNDLSKVLNWGANFTNSLDYLPFMRKLIFGKTVLLDMWTMEVYRLPKTSTSNDGPTNQGIMNEPTLPLLISKTFTNYVDLGIAARIALKFHTLREAHPELFRSRLGNKFLYGEVGVRDYLVDQSINFKDMEIWCDDERVDLDKIIDQGGLEGLAIVNIPSFGGGVEPWKRVTAQKKSKPKLKGTRSIGNFQLEHPGEDSEGPPPYPCAGESHTPKVRLAKGSTYELIPPCLPMHQSASMISFTDDEQHDISSSREQHRMFRPQKMADGRLEMIGFRSLLHLGRVQVGMADSVKIAQGRSFTLRVKHKVPYQIDGEPNTVQQAEIRIRWKCHTTVLALKEGASVYEKHRLIDDVDSLHELQSISLSIDDIKKALEKANDAGEINRDQLYQLLRRFRYLGHPQLASF